MGSVVSGVKKDQFIEDPEVIDGPDPDGHTPPGKKSAHACCTVVMVIQAQIASCIHAQCLQMTNKINIDVVVLYSAC